MSDYLDRYTMTEIAPRELKSTDLTSQISNLESDAVEAYRVKLTGLQANEPGRQDGEILFLNDQGRAGISWANEAIWVDASSAEEAMERWLDHNIDEDNDPTLSRL